MKVAERSSLYNTALQKALDSFRVLFESLAFQEEKRRIVSDGHRVFLEALYTFLHLEQKHTLSPGCKKDLRNELPDTADALNFVAYSCTVRSLSTLLDEALLEALQRLNRERLAQKVSLKEAEESSSTLNWTLRHAIQFASSLDTVLQNCEVLVQARTGKNDPDSLSILTPEAVSMNLRNSRFLRSKLKALAMELLQCSAQDDPFAAGRFFRFKEGRIVPAVSTVVPEVKDFFGYMEAKDLFREHFKAFQEGRHNIPLLLDGLPGLGKTKMTIAFALEVTDAVLVLAGPDGLQSSLEELIAQLARHPEHKFIVFFDDVEPSGIDFYYFRTYVGGSFALPSHIMTVLASNYKFPPNVGSRGRTFTFPMFDEIRCQEMIEDFLLEKGMKNISNELLSVIASDYVESYGQKIYDELSPRSLSRYLNLYLHDREKRTRLLDFSRGEVITRPDPEAFYAQNLKLLQALYGKEILEEIRDQELSGKA